MSQKRNFFDAFRAKYEAFELAFDQCIFQNERIKRWMPWIRPLLIALICLPMISVLIPLCHRAAWNSDAVYMDYFSHILTVIELFLTFSILHSFILTFAIYNRLERREFLETHSVEFDKKEVRRAICKDQGMWIELLVLQVILLLHPSNWGFFAVFAWIPGADSWHMMYRELFLVPISFAAVFVFELNARISARTVWVESPARLQQKRIWQSMAIKKRRHYDLWHMLRRLLLHIAIYTVSIVFMPFLMQVVYNVLMILTTVLFNLWLWLVVAVWILWICLRAFWTRFRFIRKLKRECRKYEYEILSIKGAYRAVLCDFQSYTLAIKAHGKLYYCRLLSSIKRSNNVHIREDGTLVRVFALRIPRLRFVNMYGGGNFSSGPNEDRTLEFFAHASVTDYTFEADGNKILILNPAARRVYFEGANGKLASIDNGDHIGEYTVFTGNAFLRALERDCADK